MTEESNTPAAEAPEQTAPVAEASTPETPTAEPEAASTTEASPTSTESLADLSTSSASEAPASNDAGIVDESGISWNGELDSLKSSEWFNTIDEKYRNPLLDGMQRKYKNLEGGFTKKTQEIAEERKAFETREKALADELGRYKRWLDTGEDLGTQALREADDLRRQLQEATEAREAFEKTLREQMEQEYIQRLSPVEQEREQLRQQLVEAQRVAAEQEQQRNEEVLEELVKWVDTTAPQLWDDNHEDALSTFTSLLEQGVARDPQTALKMVGGLYPEFNPLAAEDVPEAIDVMNHDSTTAYTNGLTETSKSYSELKQQIEERLAAIRR